MAQHAKSLAPVTLSRSNAYAPLDTTAKIAANIAPDGYKTSFEAMEQALASGEAAGQLIETTSTATEVIKTGAPITYVQPSVTSGAANVFALVNNSPHPSAAQVYLYWVYSKEGDAALANAVGVAEPLYSGPFLTPGFVYPSDEALSPTGLALINKVMKRQ